MPNFTHYGVLGKMAGVAYISSLPSTLDYVDCVEQGWIICGSQ
jgi:hypothetical protein